MALKPIGEAARFFLTRHWVRTRIGPYVVTTTEARPSAYETSVTWGEDGPEVKQFGSGLAFELSDAAANHEAICTGVESNVGLVGESATSPPAA
ncbi:MAG TPA: hypothetical protein VFU11_05280 [Solirubrobacterales bacterium]|nr:hypothetical protein [Solirubrobacterales bacterium]